MRTKIGIVTSAKMQNTVTVAVHRSVLHPLYEKRFRVTKKFLADTASQDIKEGDEVEITECRPISKRKCFKVTKVLKKAMQLSKIASDEITDIQHDHRDLRKDATKKQHHSSPSA